MAVTEHIMSEREERLNAVLADYLDAVETDQPDDRAAFLARHPDLAADIEVFFAGQDGMAELATPVRAVIHPHPAEPVSGELGDFRIIREVGRGGMGVVYEAEQISLGRRVALKVLPFAATMDPKQLQRFRNEAKAAASLHHEHIVPVYGVGCERGVHYYAMQFIDGHTLAYLIAARCGGSRPVSGDVTHNYKPGGDAPTPPVAALSTKPDLATGRAAFRQAADWLAQAAEALEYAHSMGIVHRDVKPGNLMVDAAGKLWVADFGLARFGPDAGLTMTGDLLGTLRYMAPEQALAKHGLADHRVDVYGLGCTLYELLTGKPAVGGTDKADIVRRIAFEEPVAPRKLDKAIPAELETISLKCLAKEPKERYATAGELAADLRRWLDDKPIQARPPTLWQLSARRLRRHPRAIAAVFIALLAGVIGTTWGLIRAEAQRVAAEQSQRDSLQALRETTDDVVEKLIGAKPNLGPDERAFLERTLERWQAFAGKQDNGQEARALRAEGLQRVAKLRVLLGAHLEAIDGFREAVAIRETLAAERPTAVEYQSALAQSCRSLGSELFHTGRPTEGEEQYKRALAIWERLATEFPAVKGYREDLAVSHGALAVLFKETGEWEKAQTQSRSAIDIDERLVAESPAEPKYRANLADRHADLGVVLRGLRRRQDAKQQYEQALTIWDRLARDFPNATDTLRSSANCRDNLGVLLGEMGRPKEAVEQCRRALAVRQQLAAGFPSVPGYRMELARNHSNLGIQLEYAAQPAEALNHFRKAIDIEERLVEDCPAVPTYRLLLGGSYCNLGVFLHPENKQESLEVNAKAIEALTALVADDSRLTDARVFLSRSHTDRAATLSSLGRFDEALVQWDKALEFCDPRDRPALRVKRATTLCEAGRPAAAIADIEPLIASGEWTGLEWYNFACVYSVASRKAQVSKDEVRVHGSA